MGTMTSTRIKAMRIRLRIAQCGFAKFIGVSPSSISRWERGDDLTYEEEDSLIALEIICNSDDVDPAKLRAIVRVVDIRGLCALVATHADDNFFKNNIAGKDSTLLATALGMFSKKSLKEILLKD